MLSIVIVALFGVDEEGENTTSNTLEPEGSIDCPEAVSLMMENSKASGPDNRIAWIRRSPVPVLVTVKAWGGEDVDSSIFPKS